MNSNMYSNKLTEQSQQPIIRKQTRKLRGTDLATNIRFRDPRGRVNNIGFVIFLGVLVYVLVSFIAYVNSDSIMQYEVGQGRISTTNVYKGIIVRDETVYHATMSGTVNYYLASGSKISATDTVYSIDTSGEIAQQISSAVSDGTTLSSSAKESIAESLYDFALSYDSVSFSNTYSSKDELNAQILQGLSAGVLEELSDTISKAGDTFYQMTAGTAGIVLYYTDGYESLTADTFTADDLKETSYNRQSYANGQTVEEGDVVYKLVTSEQWSVIIGISEELAEELADTSTITVTFRSDSYSTSATCSIWKKDGAYYLELGLSTAMIRYATKRYVEVELELSTETGLKILNSAITSKDFFTVPIEYFIRGGDSNSLGLLLQRTSDEEGTYTEFVSPTIYYETDSYYYISDDDVESGEIALLSDSSQQYVIGTDVDSLPGVYNVNKGYAVFKQISILYQNEEYTIIESKTDYGISLYDHIALDGSTVSEGDFVN